MVITRGLTLDISKGGFSAVLCGPPPVGEKVSIGLKFQNVPFETLAIVRYSNAARSGFQFLNLSPELLNTIDNCARRALLCPWPEEAAVQVV